MEYFLEPKEFFVGDHVLLYFCLPKGFKYKDFSIEKIKQNESMTINDISIIKINDKSYIKVDFVPWEVGDISFPSLKEIGINFEFPLIHVSSILELNKNATLQEVRPPLLLPGTTYLIYGYVISFMIACFLLTSLIIQLRKKRKSIINKLSQKYAIFIFHFTLKRLEAKLKKKMNNIDVEIRKTCIKKYEISFRLFLSSMYKSKDNWSSFTYNEIIELIKEPNGDILNLINSIFESLSLVRFANVDDEKIEKKIIKDSLRLLKLYRYFGHR